MRIRSFLKVSPAINVRIQRRNPAEKQAWYDEAIGHYTEAIDLNPEHVNAYNNRGCLTIIKGDFDNAIQDCNKAIELNPDYADSL